MLQGEKKERGSNESSLMGWSLYPRHQGKSASKAVLLASPYLQLGSHTTGLTELIPFAFVVKVTKMKRENQLRNMQKL